ncbi:hypothetical protein B0H14DRAFT_2899096 [Mycena olivaceomarginata]|nr:hypothetical protein B0H14DRAFT_2899096 [Mycena olivaceomarginata]
MAVCAGPAGAAAVSRLCRRTSPEDGRTARVGHGGDIAGGYRSLLALGMTLGVRIVIYGAKGAGRNPPKTPEADSTAEIIRWRREGVIHASLLVPPRASSSFHVGTRTEGVWLDYEKRLPAAVVDDDLIDVHKPNGTGDRGRDGGNRIAVWWSRSRQ